VSNDTLVWLVAHPLVVGLWIVAGSLLLLAFAHGMRRP
jgi:hypothetical protein